MARIDPMEAEAIAHGRWVHSPPSSPLNSFAIDTRRIEPGETFVALRSETGDGHDHLEKAYHYKAMAALVESVNDRVPIPQLMVENSLVALQRIAVGWRKKFERPVIGITGSNGKTTVKEMLGKVLGSLWYRTRGNYNNHIGVPLSLLEIDPRMHAGAILEAGINNVGEMQPLARMIRPDHAIITSVGPAHLEGLGDLQGVAHEKAILAAAVRPGGCVYLPAELLHYKAFLDLPGNLQIHALLASGADADPAWKQRHNINLHRYTWTSVPGDSGAGTLVPGFPMPSGEGFQFKAGSTGMVTNLALVVHLAMHMGVPEATIQACLDAWRPFSQRGEIVRYNKTLYYVDCYNANPGSMQDSVQRFNRMFSTEPHCYVIGTMNELGRDAADWHIQTAGNLPVSANSAIYLLGEMAPAYREGFLNNGTAPEQIVIAEDLDTLRDELMNFKGAVFLKGSRSLRMERLVPEGGSQC